MADNTWGITVKFIERLFSSNRLDYSPYKTGHPLECAMPWDSRARSCIDQTVKDEGFNCALLAIRASLCSGINRSLAIIDHIPQYAP